MPIKLKRGLFEGDYPLTQLFGENPQWYEPFGMRGHNGIDYGTPTGTQLYSCITGNVIENAYDANGYGKYIKIENDECGVIYAHMKTLSNLNLGAAVKAGDPIGISGNTGNSTGPHLHFGVFTKPRDRGNGYAGYVDPFDKNIITWVDAFEDTYVDKEVDKLKKDLESMTRNKEEWKTKARTCKKDKDKMQREYEKQLEEKDKQYAKAKELIEIVSEQKQEAINKANEYSRELVVTRDKLKDALESLQEAQETISELKSVEGVEYDFKQVVEILKDWMERKWTKFLDSLMGKKHT